MEVSSNELEIIKNCLNIADLNVINATYFEIEDIIAKIDEVLE